MAATTAAAVGKEAYDGARNTPREHLADIGATLFGGLLSEALTGKAEPVQQVRPPASADSLAGVIARLFPGTDSAAVGRIKWLQSPRYDFGTVNGSEYAYRGGGAPERMVAKANPKDNSLTFGMRYYGPSVPPDSWMNDPRMVKHEMAHLMVPQALDDLKRGRSHNQALFGLLDSYHGR